MLCIEWDTHAVCINLCRFSASILSMMDKIGFIGLGFETPIALYNVFDSMEISV
jgi:hypothetical protein